LTPGESIELTEAPFLSTSLSWPSPISPRYDLNRVSREFRLNYTKLKEKAPQFGPALQKPESIAPSFVEVAFPEATVGFPHPAARVRLVLEGGDGSRLCLEGEPPDPR